MLVNCIMHTYAYIHKNTHLHIYTFDFVFVYWHLILVTPDGPRFRSTFLPRLPLAMVVLF
jgi:hypothetical protein